MAETQSFHMAPDEFRRHGRAVVDWIADYLEEIESFPVLSHAEPGAIRSRLPDHPPATGEPVAAMLRDVSEILLPGITHWQSPNFFAYFPANNSGPSILGDLLSSGLGVQGMLWATSPACTELETHVLDWVVELLGLPERFLSSGPGGGVIQDTASSATLCALLAARVRATEGRAGGVGSDGRLTVYASTQAHSSVEKAVRIAGVGEDALRLVEVDRTQAMRPERLEALIARDVETGNTPCLVVATVGTTSSMAVDPVAAIGHVSRRFGAWLHVDAAMAGTAAVCPELRSINEGLELSDSYCFNPHKWMFVNFDCDCFFVADRRPLLRALSVLPEYLRNAASQSGAVIDYRDWQIPLGRRFRALKLWFVIRHYGVEGLRHHVREHVRIARELASWVKADPDFELAEPQTLNLVCFRHRGGDGFNERLLDRLNASGALYLTHTRIDGRYTLRMSIGQTGTQRRHVEAAWERIRTEASRLAPA
ncbi:pyridoxal-dependent decarboxylase [soil metagenome]